MAAAAAPAASATLATAKIHASYGCACGDCVVCDRVNNGTGAGHRVGAVVWIALGVVRAVRVMWLVRLLPVATLCLCARACVHVFVMVNLKWIWKTGTRKLWRKRASPPLVCNFIMIVKTNICFFTYRYRYSHKGQLTIYQKKNATLSKNLLLYAEFMTEQSILQKSLKSRPIK
jgi:hypothetical protein